MHRREIMDYLVEICIETQMGNIALYYFLSNLQSLSINNC